MNSEKHKNILFNAIVWVCIALFCFSITPRSFQNDTYYTIKIGEYITQNGIGNLTEDPFSWHDLSYTYPHWLYDFLTYQAYSVGEFFGVYVLTVGLSVTLGILLYSTCCKISKNNVVSAIITFCGIYMLDSFVAARAQLATYLLFIWQIYSIESYIENKKKIHLVSLLIIPILIANLHCAVYPFYYVLFLPYLAEYFLIWFVDFDILSRINVYFYKLRMKLTKKEEKIIKLKEKIDREIEIKEKITNKRNLLRSKPYKIQVEKNPAIKVLAIIFLISTLAGLVTPLGETPYTYLYKTMEGNTTQNINEHQPLVLIQNDEYLITLLIFALILIFTDTKIKLRDLFMLAGVLYLTLTSKRQVSIFVIVCAPILCKLIANLIAKYDPKLTKKAIDFTTNAFGTIIIVCLVLIVSLKQYKPKIGDEFVSSYDYPVEAAEWIIDNLDYENIKFYNEYNYGSYLLFKGIPVFIDSRADLYAPEFNTKTGDEKDGKDIFSDALNIAGLGTHYEKKFEEYGISHIIAYENAKLSMLLEKDSNYKLLYQDSRFKIFERKNAVVVNEGE